MVPTLLTGFPKQPRKKDCYSKKLCIELQGQYKETIFPVCPILQTQIEPLKLYDYDLTNIPKTDSTLLNSIKRILAVCRGLTELKPALGVQFCAHRENFLRDWLQPIEADLKALPQRLEKDYPDTSNDCKELVAGVDLAILKYSYHCGCQVYMVPPDLKYHNWASFLEWQDRLISQAGRKMDKAIEINRLTCQYPAETIRAANKLIDKLSPLAENILPKKTAKNAQLESIQVELIAKAIAQIKSLSCNEEINIDNEEDLSNKKQKLSCSVEKAYQQFDSYQAQYVNCTDREAYDWLKKHNDGDPLPNFDTWTRYLRKARNFYGTNKNTPRSGRETGKSIVSCNQI